MTKPQMIRADTIDLQDHNAPSAKDHSRQPTSPAPIGDGPPAPHQASHLRHASLDEHSLSSRSPRASQDLSNKELQLLHDQHSDDDDQDSSIMDQGLGGQRNGDLGGQDGEVDGEDDESLDDDMMDKISSSPSIDDGGYPRRGPWPARGESLSAKMGPESVQHLPDDESLLSSSPYNESPKHLPLAFSPQKEEDEDPDYHHIPGEYPKWSQSPRGSPDRLRPLQLAWEHEPATPPRRRAGSLPVPLPPLPQSPPPESPPHPLKREDSMESRDKLMPMVTEQAEKLGLGKFSEGLPKDEYNEDFENDISGLEDLLVPLDDPLLDNSFDEDDIKSKEPSPVQDNHSVEYLESDDSQLVPFDFYINEGADCDDKCYEDLCFVLIAIGGIYLQTLEDIDFEFVYALHTFVATVEGQANATKGDTMVLLDDSNSYWWLVRVVKDSSIGDNPEKSRNPLKKALKRRKTVQFSEPTYYEASEVEYSTEDENDSELDFGGGSDTSREDSRAQNQESQDSRNGLDYQDGTEKNEPDRPEPLRVEKGQKDPADDSTSENTIQGPEPTADSKDEKPRTSSEVLESQQDNSQKTGQSQVNRDSYYKNPSIETRKMTLTPGLLRDEGPNNQNATMQDVSRFNPPKYAIIDHEQNKARRSLEGSEKPASQASLEKSKDEKEKDKKPSKFSKIFSRNKDKKKDKKGKAEDDDELARELKGGQLSPQPKMSSETTSIDGQTSPQKPQPARQSSKLQKQPPSKQNSLRKGEPKEEPQPQPRTTPVSAKAPRVSSALIPDGTLINPFEDLNDDDSDFQNVQPSQADLKPSSGPPKPSDNSTDFAAPQSDSALRNVFSPLRDALRTTPASAEEPKATKVKKAKNRMALDDDTDDSGDDQHVVSAFPVAPLRQPPETAKQQSSSPTKERLSDSPVQVSPVIGPTHPPPLVGDSSSHDEPVSPVSPSSSPSLIDHPIETPTSSKYASAPTPQPPGAFSPALRPALQSTPPLQQTEASLASASTTPVSTRTQSEWSDAHLRQYLETATDEIRDLLLVVSDTSDVVVDKNNPQVKKFEPDMERFKSIEKKLDRMMVDLCSRNKL